MALRRQEIAKSTRPFKARGYKVKRCEHCLIPQNECICASRPKIESSCAFCFIMYRNEYFKPSNTGRIIADVIKDNHAFIWDRTKPNPALLSLLADPHYVPILVFPEQYAEPARCIDSLQDMEPIQLGKTPLFVMLDGTWREAKKMFKSPNLANIPVLGIHPEQASNYQLREAAHNHQLCTAEVAIELLKLAEENQPAQALAKYFQIFKAAYMVHKPHLQPIIQSES